MPPKDPQALADAIERFMSLGKDARQAMSEASRRRAEERFDVSKVIEVYERVIHESQKQ